MQLYSYDFIANSTSYLNAAGFLEFFSVPVISWVESIGGGRVRMSGKPRQAKATIRTQAAMLYLQHAT